MADHRPAGNLVQHFRQRGLHPGALAGGKNYGGEICRHRRSLAFPEQVPLAQPRGRVACTLLFANTQIVAEYDAAGAILAVMEKFLLLFDLDGTLVDTLPDLTNALNEVLSERGHAPLSQADVKPMIGDGMPALLARGFAARGADTAEAKAMQPRFVEIYEAGATNLSRPYPGVPETLAALRERGYGTAVCTNKPQHATGEVLRGMGLAGLFDGWAGGDRFAVRKPDPGHLLGLVEVLGGDPKHAAMIGDSENDALSARAAPMPLILMRYGYARIDPAQLGADRLLDRFDELPGALASLGLSSSA
jgi:phosphoglycolate phosphatase